MTSKLDLTICERQNVSLAFLVKLLLFFSIFANSTESLMLLTIQTLPILAQLLKEECYYIFQDDTHMRYNWLNKKKRKVFDTEK